CGGHIVFASPATGGELDTVFVGRLGGPVVWGRDGNIYVSKRLEDGTRTRACIPPPAKWRTDSADPKGGTPCPTLAPGMAGRPRNMLTSRRFDCGPPPVEAELPALDSLGSTGHLFLHDEFPDGRRWLISKGTGQSYVVDQWGRTQVALPTAADWTAVSDDGR